MKNETTAPAPEDELDSILERLEAEHGKIEAWETEDVGLVVAARPKNAAAQYEALFNSLASEGDDKAVALRNFGLACIVYPTDAAKIATLKRDAPAFLLTVGTAGQKLCGSGYVALGKGSKKRARTQ